MIDFDVMYRLLPKPRDTLLSVYHLLVMGQNMAMTSFAYCSSLSYNSLTGYCTISRETPPYCGKCNKPIFAKKKKSAEPDIINGTTIGEINMLIISAL